MAVTQDLTLVLRLRSILTNPGALDSVISDLVKNITVLLPTGTASGQANMAFRDQRTLAASATEDLDLAGVLTNAFGSLITFVKVKLVLVVAAGANTNAVRVTRPASNGVPLFVAAGDGIDVLPGGYFLFVGPGAGVTVTPSTGDLLTITNGGAGTPVTYDVVILGTV